MESRPSDVDHSIEEVDPGKDEESFQQKEDSASKKKKNCFLK